MQRLLENKVAVITSAGRGIGETIARKLAGEGAAIAVCDVMLDNAKQVADSKQVPKVCDRIVADFGRVDILVNNAGITRDGLRLRVKDTRIAVSSQQSGFSER